MRSRLDQLESPVIADTAAFMPAMVTAIATDKYALAAADQAQRPGTASARETMDGRMDGRKISWTAPALVGALALIACEPESESDKTDAGVSETSAAAAAEPDDPGAELKMYDGKPYKVYADGKVDPATWLGSRLYGNICFHCHGDKGAGSSFAPSLYDSLQAMSYDDFVTVVAEGIKNVGGTQSSVMPAYAENTTIMENVDGIYAYLKAAADGALPGGDLEKKEPKDE